MSKLRESIGKYIERHSDNLPLNAVGRLAIAGGFGGIVLETVRNAPTSRGLAPLAATVIGCAIEIATKPPHSESA